MIDSEKKAGSILLKDLALFNKTAVYFDKNIASTIHNELSGAINNWAESCSWHFGDEGEGDFEELWVSPSNWQLKEDAYYAWFQIRRRSGNDSASYDAADLFGVGQTDFGFAFEIDHSEFGGRKSWNGYAKTIDTIGLQLGERGWVHEGKGVFFRPLVLPVDRLPDAWENEDWSAVVEPLECALEQLIPDIPVFNCLIDGAKKFADR